MNCGVGTFCENGLPFAESPERVEQGSEITMVDHVHDLAFASVDDVAAHSWVTKGATADARLALEVGLFPDLAERAAATGRDRAALGRMRGDVVTADGARGFDRALGHQSFSFFFGSAARELRRSVAQRMLQNHATLSSDLDIHASLKFR
jgi:hypothetical protein